MVATTDEAFFKTAFVSGYALAGPDALPIQHKRFAASLRSALNIALEHADHPRIIEATLQIGKAEGIWAGVLNRREDVYKAAHEGLVPIVTRLFSNVSAQLLTDDLFKRVGSTTGADVLEVAKAAALKVLQGLLENDPMLNEDWRQLAHDMHLQAYAEGYAQAHVMMDESKPTESEPTAAGLTVEPNFHIYFTQAMDSLQNLDRFWADADHWVSDQVSGLSGDLGQAMATSYNAGETRQEMRTRVQSILTNVANDTTGANFYMDSATGTALSQGSLALYNQENLNAVDYITAGDEQVCLDCDEKEAYNPYSPNTVPVPPVHGGCRCIIAPAGTIS